MFVTKCLRVKWFNSQREVNQYCVVDNSGQKIGAFKAKVEDDKCHVISYYLKGNNCMHVQQIFKEVFLGYRQYIEMPLYFNASNIGYCIVQILIEMGAVLEDDAKELMVRL